jgi:hypothetical protein
MKMNVVTVSFALVGLLASCGNDASHRDVQTVSNSANSSKTVETAESVRVKAPKALMARVKTSELGLQSANIEMVEVDLPNRAITGSEAAKLFASGRTLDLREGSTGLEAANSQHSLMLGTVQVPGQVPVQIPVQVPVGGAGYADCGVGCGGVNILGGIINFFGSIIQGAVYTIDTILVALNPFTWIGNYGVSYQNQGAYQYGGYQYYPYAQGPIYNNPNQGGKPGVEPYPQYPNNQYPQYPQYPNNQYPNYPQYPNNPQNPTPQPLPGQPNQPAPPIGQEPMPNNG